MKDFFDKHKESLTHEEKQAIWASLRSELRHEGEAGRRFRIRGFLGGPRTRLWAFPAAGALVTAVLVAMLMRHEPAAMRTSVQIPGAQVLKESQPPSGPVPEAKDWKIEGARPSESDAESQVEGAPVVPDESAPGGAGPERLQDRRPMTDQVRQGQPLPPSLEKAKDMLQETAPRAAPPSLVPPRAVRSDEIGDAGALRMVNEPKPVGTEAGAQGAEVEGQEAETEESSLDKGAEDERKGAAPDGSPSARASAGSVTASSPVESSRTADLRGAPGSDTERSRAQPSPALAAPPRPAPAGAEGSIEGTVEDGDGKPLSYANVLVVGTNWGAFSGDDGTFRIGHVPPGTYTVTASVLGYTEETIDRVKVDSARPTTLHFRLKERPVGSLAEVEIHAAKPLLQRRSTQISPPASKEKAGQPPASGSSVVIPLKAGVEADKRDMHVRGGRSDGTWGAIRQAYSPPGDKQQPPVLPTTGGETLPNDEVYDSMFFKHYGVNPFIATDEDSLSTFAVDVDAASYTVMRRYVELGHLPPPEAVRVEEFVNFFPQGYPHFQSPDFRVLCDAAPSPFGPGYQLLRVGIKGREIAEKDRKPANLVFVIDTSGSMNREDRLELVKRALFILLDRLRPDDRIGVVVFGSTARILLSPAGPEQREKIYEAINLLRPEGSTNAEQGLLLGFEMARMMRRPGMITRVLLCSDGVANVGRTAAESILETVRGQADAGVSLSTIGFGMGNLNDVLLEQLADKGDGNYYYVDDLKEARRVFEENLTGTLQVIARDAKVQVEFDPRRVLRYRLLGFENRDVADRDFRNDRVDAGEIGAGHEVTALYEIKLAPEAAPGRLATVRLRYALPEHEDGGAPKVREIEQGFEASAVRSRFDEAPAGFRLDAAVAEFAEILRGSYWAKESRVADILPVARAAARDLPDSPQAQEFVKLLEQATEQTDKLTPEERERIHGRWNEPPAATEPAGRDGR